MYSIKVPKPNTAGSSPWMQSQENFHSEVDWGGAHPGLTDCVGIYLLPHLSNLQNLRSPVHRCQETFHKGTGTFPPSPPPAEGTQKATVGCSASPGSLLQHPWGSEAASWVREGGGTRAFLHRNMLGRGGKKKWTREFLRRIWPCQCPPSG